MSAIRVLLFTLVAIPGTNVVVAAQGGAAERSVGGDFEHAGRDVLYVWSAPIHSSQDDWRTALLIAGGTGLALSADASVHEWIHARRTDFPLDVLEWFGEDSPLNLYGRTKLLVPVSAVLYLSGVIFSEPALRDAGIGCMTANIANTLSRHALARVLGRARPQEQRGAWDFRVPNFADDWEMRSFPSGHAANAMACTTFWAKRFDLGLGEPILYTLAGVIGTARMIDEAHWLSDTLFGMSWGVSIGKAVAERYDGRAAGEHSGAVQPAAVLTWRLEF